jgi:hypothetical protein
MGFGLAGNSCPFDVKQVATKFYSDFRSFEAKGSEGFDQSLTLCAATSMVACYGR